MENLEKLEIPTIEFTKVTLLNGNSSNGCTGANQTHTTTGSNGVLCENNTCATDTCATDTCTTNFQ